MVFLTAVNFLREFQKFGRPGGGPDKFWRVQQYLRFSWVRMMAVLVWLALQ